MSKPSRRIAAALAAALLFAAPAYADSYTSSDVASFTPSASAYSAGQCLGAAGASAVQTVNLVVSQGTGGVTVTDATIVDSSGQGPSIDLYLFTAQPQGTYTDQAACSLAAADQPNVIGPISFTTFVAFGTPKTSRQSNLWQAVNVATASAVPVTSRTVWFVLVNRGTPTFGAAQNVRVRIGGLTDTGAR